MTPDEVRMLDNRYAILFIRGERPILDEKFDILKHPNVELTTDGNGKPYLHGTVGRAVANISLGDSLEEEFTDDSLESDDYELLSDEDLEEIIQKYQEIQEKYIGGYQKMKLDMRKKQEKKETTKSTKKLPMTAKMKRAMAVYVAMVLIMTAGASTVFAADDPLTVINNLSTFIFGLIRAIGMILLGFGIVQVGLSLKSHDPSQRANGFLTLAGGVIITFAKEILNLITG